VPRRSFANTRRFVVLGGAGTIGRIVVRDLLESHPHNCIICADIDEGGARDFASGLGSRRVSGARADVTAPAALARVLRGQSVVINCTQHTYNLAVMQAALEARLHYVDLGGLFTWTRRQLRMGEAFEGADLTAVLGMGCAPGITNVLSRLAVERLGRVERLEIKVAAADRNRAADAFLFAYSPQTVVEELTLRPWVFARGRFRTVAPRSGWELVPFPPPVGPSWVVRTRHSEVATLPVTFRGAGLRMCDFKVGFDRRFVRDVMRRLRNGQTLGQLAQIGQRTTAPDDDEISRVVATGPAENGTRQVVTIDCGARARVEWQASAGDVDTGIPASIVAQMIATGAIATRGVLAPEVAVPVPSFLDALTARGLRVSMRESQIG
jgi:saccharopine dehydrogenase-like NADP-dependent oxidoreductase